MTPEILAVVGTGVAILAVLVPLILTLHTRLASDLADLRRKLKGDVSSLREDVAGLRRDVGDIDRRLARIEGAVLGPWRPDPPEKEAAA